MTGASTRGSEAAIAKGFEPRNGFGLWDAGRERSPSTARDGPSGPLGSKARNELGAWAGPPAAAVGGTAGRSNAKPFGFLCGLRDRVGRSPLGVGSARGRAAIVGLDGTGSGARRAAPGVTLWLRPLLPELQPLPVRWWPPGVALGSEAASTPRCGAARLGERHGGRSARSSCPMVLWGPSPSSG